MGIIKVPSPNATAPQEIAGCIMGIIINGEWWLPYFLGGGGIGGVPSRMPRKTRQTTNAKMASDDIVCKNKHLQLLNKDYETMYE